MSLQTTEDVHGPPKMLDVTPELLFDRKSHTCCHRVFRSHLTGPAGCQGTKPSTTPLRAKRSRRSPRTETEMGTREDCVRRVRPHVEEDIATTFHSLAAISCVKLGYLFDSILCLGAETYRTTSLRAL